MADDLINQQQFAEDVAAATGEDGFVNFADADGNMKMPSVKEVWNMIEHMEGISDEERAILKKVCTILKVVLHKNFKTFARPAAAAV
ncbi:hypothetical protein EVAR_69268_1, partial [Eumeta japonica]